MASDSAVLVLDDDTTIGKTHYLRFVQSPTCKRAELRVQVTYSEVGLTPAFVRMAARDLAQALARIADDLDTHKGVAHGD